MATPTHLDALKDAYYIVKDRLGYALDRIHGDGVEIPDDADDVFTSLEFEVASTLAQFIPGMSVQPDALVVFDNAEARKQVETYDDGSPLSELIEFPDVPGYGFVYRPRFSGPRDEFLAQARNDADAHAARIHECTAEATGTTEGERVFVEYIGDPDGAFHLSSHDGDSPGHIRLNRDQLMHLRFGIDRILDTQLKDEAEIRETTAGALRKAAVAMQVRVPEILAAVTAGTATSEQLGCVVELPNGISKTWANLTPAEIEDLRRAHAF